MNVHRSQTAPVTLLRENKSKAGVRRRSSTFLEETLPECREVPLTAKETEEKEVKEKAEDYLTLCKHINDPAELKKKIVQHFSDERFGGQMIPKEVFDHLMIEIGEKYNEKHGGVTTSQRSRILLAGALEILDEISDIYVAILFSFNAALSWASHAQWSFILLNRYYPAHEQNVYQLLECIRILFAQHCEHVKALSLLLFEYSCSKCHMYCH